MFASGLRESRERVVEVSDLDISAVRALLLFVYSGEVSPALLADDEATLGLLAAANKYAVEALVARCTATLVRRLSVANAADRLAFADSLGCVDFRAKCVQFVRDRITEVQETEAYELLRQNHPGVLADLIEALTSPSKKKRKLDVEKSEASLALLDSMKSEPRTQE